MKASEVIEQEKSWVVVKSKIKKDIFVAIDSDYTSCSTGHCGASGIGCQSNIFAGLFAPSPLLKLKNVPTEININDKLLLSLARQAVFRLALVGYAIPLVALLLGAWVGQTIAGDWLALLVGFSALLLTWYIVGRWGLVIEPEVLEVRTASV